MVLQYKTVLKLNFIIIFIFNPFLKSQQLALPKNVVAIVDTHKISLEEFTNRYEDYLFTSGVKDNRLVRRAILDNMINEILLLHYDNNDLIFQSKEYQNELEWARKQTILSFLKDQEVYANITASDAEIREAYLKSNEKIAARHLFAETEEEANNLYQLLMTGADFNQLAKQVFSDTTLANNGGYLGFFSWGDMDPNFEDAAYSLKIGEISKPVKTKYGYSIIKLEDRRPHPLLTEDEYLRKKSHMESVVKIRKKRPAEIEYLSKLFNPNNLKIDKKILGNIYQNLTYSLENSIELRSNSASNEVVARYGDKTYLQSEIEIKILEIPSFHRQKISSVETLETVIKGLVIQDLLIEQAMNKNYNENQFVLSTIDKYEKNIFLRYKRTEVSNNYRFPQEEIYKFYNDNPNYFMNPVQVNLQEIIINDRNLADSLVGRINNGEDFGTLAEKFSIRKWSAENKGIMGFADIDKFGFLKDTLLTVEVNKVIGPIEIEGRFGIFKLLERVDKRLKDFELVKTDAERLLKKERSAQIMKEYLEKLEKQVSIIVDEKLLNTAVLSYN
ncbi:MAG: peptidylprolyl isomerase [Bacteroidota bacterium]